MILNYIIGLVQMDEMTPILYSRKSASSLRIILEIDCNLGAIGKLKLSEDIADVATNRVGANS